VGGGGCVESPTTMTAWYFFSDKVPEGEVIVPIKTGQGLAFAVRPGVTAEEIVDALNETARFVLGVGLAHLGHTEREKPPDAAQKE
ncbi:hypothetical protein, partial [Streptomyces sp. NPDC002265]|uniref:hypothetical protein n=1 Tax=Streptomyces sp. NPDC002265 TaxID=3154415 RepID=UPI00332F371D